LHGVCGKEIGRAMGHRLWNNNGNGPAHKKFKKYPLVVREKSYYTGKHKSTP
jgi:hypothetical protein